jgi:radical SAM superfamily enzyme YgiQ (UPF0313 family)
MTKRVVFVHTPCPELDDDRLEPPLGILYLATLLKKQNVPCKICDLSSFPEKDWEHNLEFGNIYAFSTYSVTYHRTVKIKQIIKSKINPYAITIAGGPHASALPEEVKDDFDIVITGEAELIFPQIIHSLLKGDQIKGTFLGKPISHLDYLPFPNYELIDLASYHRLVEGLPALSIITSRGCPYKCTFCNSRVFERGQVRFRSPENVAKEITFLKNKYGIKAYRFNDDLFAFSEQRVIEMCNALKPLNILYRIFVRADRLTTKVAKLLYDSGCRHVSIGIETMSEKMLKLLNKGTTVQTNINSLVNAKKAGLKTRIYLLIGYLGETDDTVQESLDILLQCDFDEFCVYPFIPYPGTPVWEEPQRFGAHINRDFSKYIQVGRRGNTFFAVTTTDFTPEDVKKWREMIISALQKKALWAGKSPDNR